MHLNAVVEALKTEFSEWDSVKPFEVVINWLLSLGYLRTCAKRTYILSDEGRAMAEAYTPFKQIDLLKSVSNPYGRYLIIELMEAAHDGGHYLRFEKIMTEVCLFLGFAAQHVSGSGNPDVVADSWLTFSRYRVIFDPKARTAGKLSALVIDTILEHKSAYKADDVVVVANSLPTAIQIAMRGIAACFSCP